ncbi:hypothetical protein B296_00030944 [Ensete ventricosum]|uniref:Uncharacterized protein n=1 Tax=Ensete ventricosum TaxID=4639 RepID=A0A426YXX4_ENSVE|nr:hypothetical protein B296_00030944 [Ensete ventricosum]
MTHDDLVATSSLPRTTGPSTWSTRRGKLVERRYEGAKGRATDLAQVRPNPQRSYGRPTTGKADTLTCGRMPYRKDGGCGGGVRWHCKPQGWPGCQSPTAPNRGIPPDVEPPQPQVAEARAASPTPTPARSQSRSYNPVSTKSDFDTLSTDTADSLREQVRRVYQRLDEVQNEVLKSREEVEESSKGGSPFTHEIPAKPLPATFRLSALEPYDGSGDPTEHIATFRAQMALYDTSEALILLVLDDRLPKQLGSGAHQVLHDLQKLVVHLPSPDSRLPQQLLGVAQVAPNLLQFLLRGLAPEELLASLPLGFLELLP